MIPSILKKQYYFAFNVVTFISIMLGTLNAAENVLSLNPRASFQAYPSEMIPERMNANIPKQNKEILDDLKASLDDLLEVDNIPDFIEVVVNIVPVYLPSDQNYTASYQLDDYTWPAVPLYPEEEGQFVSALELVYRGVIKTRSGSERESVRIRGKIIEGFEFDVKDEEPVYTHSFDYVNQSIHLHVIKKRTLVPIWPVGGFYRPGCSMDQIQQAFCSLTEQAQKTFARKTLLHQWNDQGLYPPQSNQREGQQTVFQTTRQKVYVKFIEDIQKGVATIHLIDPKSNDGSFCCTYQSLDIKSYGMCKAIIHFMRIS